MQKKIRAFVDRIEGKVAVLFLGEAEEDEIHIPVGYLPKSAREGSVLSIKIEFDEQETRATQSEAAELIERLQRRNRLSE